jgi:ankyrin repeat protein
MDSSISAFDAYEHALLHLDVQEAKRAIALGCIPGKVLPSGAPSLHFIVQRLIASDSPADLDAGMGCMELAIAAGASLNTRDVHDNTVLHVAVMPRTNGTFADNQASLISRILAWEDFDVHAVNRDGLTAVLLAAAVGNVSALDCFFGFKEPCASLPLAIAAGATKSGSALLLRHRELLPLACRHGRVEVVRYLLETPFPRLRAILSSIQQAEGNDADESDRSFLFDISPQDQKEFSLWQRQGTPFQQACASGQMEAVEYLINFALARRTTAEEHREEMERTSQRYHEHLPRKWPAAVIKLLAETDQMGRCALHYAADGKLDNNVNVMSFLIAIKGDLPAQLDFGQRSAMQSALRSGRRANAKFLLEKYGAVAGEKYKASYGPKGSLR